MDISLFTALTSLNVELVKSSRYSATGICPCCGRKTLSFDFKKNRFNCVACSEVHGNTYDAWAIYRGLKSDPSEKLTKEGYLNVRNDIDAYFSYTPADIKTKKFKEKEFELKELPIANIEERHKTYSSFLKMLTLSEDHKKSLISRGFNESEIEKNEYKSYPAFGIKELCQNLLDKGCILEGVPGFYKNKDGDWIVRSFSVPAFFIPIRDIDGRIQAMQLRMDFGKPKYLFFSSGSTEDGTHGSSPKAFSHFRGSLNSKSVVLTEGPLKGDLINKFKGSSIVAIPGVTSTNELMKLLSKLKNLKKIFIAFDMDYRENENVKRALIKLDRILEDAGYSRVKLEWNDAYKGLDDYLKSELLNN